MSRRVGSATSESGIVENGGIRWNRFASSFRSKVISTSGFMAEMWNSGCRPMAGPVGSDIPGSSMVENVRVAVELSFAVVTQALACNRLISKHFRFSGRHIRFWKVSDMV